MPRIRAKNGPRCQVCSDNFKKGEKICIDAEGTRHHADCNPKLKKPSARQRDIPYQKRLAQSRAHTDETHIGVHAGILSTNLNKIRKYIAIMRDGKQHILWATSLTEARKKAEALEPEKVMELGKWRSLSLTSKR